MTNKEKWELLLAFLAARAAEPSTWQGVTFLLTLCGSRYAELDWGQCVAVGSGLVALFKMFSPDTWTKLQNALKENQNDEK